MIPHFMARDRLLAALLTIATLSACAGPRQATVVQTTDIHGAFAGLRPLARHLDALRAVDDGPAVLVVDSGDMWSGTLLSDPNEGAVGVAAFNAIGYDAVALGNHEFDFGPVGDARVGDDPFGALRARLAEARFPVLCANLVERATERPPAWPNLRPSVIIARGGVNIGLVGVITPDTPRITFPYVDAQLRFDDPAAAVVREATALRTRGADVVLVLAHIGARCAPAPSSDDLSSCNADAPLLDLVRAVPAGLVDGWLGGHSHGHIHHRVAGVPVTQAPAKAAGAAHLDIDLERPAPAVTLGTHLSFDTSRDMPPPGPIAIRVDAVLNEVERKVDAIRSAPLGATAAQPFGRSWTEGSALGALVCDALLDRYPGHHVCLANSGGLRHDLPAGPLNYGHVYDALPFGNATATLDVSGAQLRELLRIGTSGAHGVIQVGGLAITYDRGKDGCPAVDRDGDCALTDRDRDRLVEVTRANGAPLNPDARYRVITSSFLALGGDGWRPVVSALSPERVVVHYEDLSVREGVAEWLRDQRAPLTNADRRVTAIGEDSKGCPVGADARE